MQLVGIKNVSSIRAASVPVFDITTEHNHNFILKNGIVAHNCDTGQILGSEGYRYEVISVDKVDSDHVCKPYQYFRSSIYEKRIEMYENVLLTEELIDLERNNNSGKIDHSQNRSKDQADAVCGALYNASKHAEEFAFDYGETLDTITQANSSYGNYDKKQLSVDFQEALSQAMDPLHSVKLQIQKRDEDNFRDFGMGKAQPVSLVSDGILVW